MTISSEVRKAGPYQGGSAATSFPFTFKVFSADQVGVILTGLDGSERVAVSGMDYTVHLNVDQDASPGGSVSLPAPMAAGYLLTVTSHVPYLQHLDLTNHGGFFPRQINQALDRATVQIQQLAEQVDRSVKTPISSNYTPEALVNELLTGANVASAAAEHAAESANYVARHADTIAVVAQNIESVQAVVANAGRLQSVADALPDIERVSTNVLLADKLASPNPNEGASMIAGAQRVIETMADLRAYPKTGTPNIVLRRYNADGPTIDSQYDLDPADSTAVDDGVLTIVAADGGRWKLRHNGQISFRQAGAYGNSSETAGGGHDDTAAIQRMLDTGLAITPDLTSVYRTDKPIVSKGQPIPKGTRFWYPKVSAQIGQAISSVDPAVNPLTAIKLMYVETDYALQSMLAIKSLGFNSIHHYCYFAGYPWAGENPGDANALKDNCRSAGLWVSIGTEWTSDIPTIINTWDEFELTFAYSIWDEPVMRGFTKADQDARIAQFRALTKKMLTAVDIGGGVVGDREETFWGVPLANNLSDKYDVVYCNAYSRNYNWGTLAQKINWDIGNMVSCFGEMKAKSKARTIPCVGTFLMRATDLYAADMNQVEKASLIFSHAAGDGSYACFVWDGFGDTGILNRAMNNIDLWNLCKKIALTNINGSNFVTDAHLFGKREDGGVWDFSGLTAITHVKSVVHPEVLIANTPASDYVYDATPYGRVLVGGLAYKFNNSKWRSNKCAKHLTFKIAYGDFSSGQNANIGVYSSPDNYSYTEAAIATKPAQSAGPYVFGSFKNPHDNGLLSIGLVGNSGFVDGSYYSKFFSGLIVFSNWGPE